MLIRPCHRSLKWKLRPLLAATSTLTLQRSPILVAEYFVGPRLNRTKKKDMMLTWLLTETPSHLRMLLVRVVRAVWAWGNARFVYRWSTLRLDSTFSFGVSTSVLGFHWDQSSSEVVIFSFQYVEQQWWPCLSLSVTSSRGEKVWPEQYTECCGLIAEATLSRPMTKTQNNCEFWNLFTPTYVRAGSLRAHFHQSIDTSFEWRGEIRAKRPNSLIQYQKCV